MSVPRENPNKSGRLIMAANTIGPNSDIPQRSLTAVQNADLVIFEEDRIARQVLKTAGVHREYWRYSEHAQADTLAKLQEILIAGKTAVYMSDQGLPVVADPGTELLKVAYRCGARVSVIPGPSAALAALAACPFIDDAFHFAGFLPREPELRLKKMQQLDQLHCPVVIFDTPYRRQHLLETAVTAYGSHRKGLLALDISGEAEDFVFNSLGKLLEHGQALDTKLNFVLVIDRK